MTKCGFLIDMDGVMYRGSTPIAGAMDFISLLREYKFPYMFVTNNSQRSRLDVVYKLENMGITGVKEREIFTCSIATARFLATQSPSPSAFVIGESGLLSALNHFGVAITDHNPDYVIVGEGRTVNFENIEAATTHILNGAKLIATNMDPNCPIANGGTRPGTGAVVAMLEQATGRKAFDLGKPSPIMMRYAQKELGIHSSRITMIGDTMSTDILGGILMGYRTVLVLSGGTRAEDLDDYGYLPNYVVSDIGALARHLQQNGSILIEPTLKGDSSSKKSERQMRQEQLH